MFLINVYVISLKVILFVIGACSNELFMFSSRVESYNHVELKNRKIVLMVACLCQLSSSIWNIDRQCINFDRVDSYIILEKNVSLASFLYDVC